MYLEEISLDLGMIRGGRSGIHSGSVRVYSGFGFSGSKISAPFGYF